MHEPSVDQYLQSHICTVLDWPAPGVQFRDIKPLFRGPKVFRLLIDAFVHRYMDRALRLDVVGVMMPAALSWERCWPMN